MVSLEVGFQIENILVIQTAFLGDCILATSLLEKLHLAYPASKITYLVRKGHEGLFENHPFLHEVWVWEKSKKKYGNLWGLLKKTRFGKFDLIINGQRHFSTGIITAFGGAKRSIGYGSSWLSIFFSDVIGYQFADGRHEVERYDDLIAHLVDNKALGEMKLYPQDKHFKGCLDFSNAPYLLLFPSSVWFTKQLPLEKWGAFINEISADYHIYLCGGPGDQRICEELLAICSHSKVRNIAGRFSLLEVAALMSGAKMVYVNDSGPLHLASAVNAPVTAVFCSTSPSFGFTPRSTIAHVVESAEPLDCRPCGQHGHRECPQGHFACGKKIAVEQLLETINVVRGP